MRTKCYSVRVESMRRITARAYKVRTFDGREDIIPASQVFGIDFDVTKSDAYWVAARICSGVEAQQVAGRPNYGDC